MGVYLPIVVAAPAGRRERLFQSGVLPQRWFRDISSELWETDPDSPKGKSAPSIYVWPYDIPYGRSAELRESASERVADIPAFFGMPQDNDPRLRAHQECMLSPVLFGSIVVHVVFLDNSQTDTTPGFDERNETYAQLDTFDKIIQWTKDFKKAMNFRFPNNRSGSRHILVLVSPGQQVITTKDKIQDLNDLIGAEGATDERPFCACYFLNEHLEPGGAGELFHSENIWDLLVSRFLLSLLLIQSEEKNWLKEKRNHGVNIWRAEDCIIPLAPDSGRDERIALEKASRKLLDLVSETADKAGLRLLADAAGVARNDLTCLLAPTWETVPGKKAPDFMEWAANPSATQAVPLRAESFRRNWSVIFRRNWSALPVAAYEAEIESPEHWRTAFEELRKERIRWSSKHPSEYYTSDVQAFFKRVHREPQKLGSLTDQLFVEMKKTSTTPCEKENDPAAKWPELVAEKEAHRQLLKRLAEDSKEFKKAQDYYVGTGPGLIVAGVVTGFAGWMIWQVFSLFNVGIPKILLLFVMVFAGSAVAYILVMLLHNFTGHRAAVRIMTECKEADDKKVARAELVKGLFFGGIEKRNTLMLQSVRFRAWHLASRAFVILEKELKPQLSALIDEEEESDTESESAADPHDPYRVRKAYLRRTRSPLGLVYLDTYGPIWEKHDVNAAGKANSESEDLNFNDDFKKESEELTDLLEGLFSEDTQAAGYFPARMFIRKIRDFVSDFLGKVHDRILEESIENQLEDLKKGFGLFVDRFRSVGDESLLSAPLVSWGGGDGTEAAVGNVFQEGEQTKILFVHPQFYSKDPLGEGGGNRKVELQKQSAEVLKETRIAALYYHEFRVEFDVQKRDDSSERGDLIFKAIKKRTVGCE